jgi:hypothetical protein
MLDDTTDRPGLGRVLLQRGADPRENTTRKNGYHQGSPQQQERPAGRWQTSQTPEERSRECGFEEKLCKELRREVDRGDRDEDDTHEEQHEEDDGTSFSKIGDSLEQVERIEQL